MARSLGPVLRHLERLLGRQHSDLASDRQLLLQFAADKDEAAFATLVRRHGPMVLGVCRRLLGDEHLADDAFQATFLVLARRAASLRWQESIANWLYGVAQRIAIKARRASHRRDTQERPMGSSSDLDELHPLPDDASPLAETTRRELCRVLDEELMRLPTKYRASLVLCYLEGKTNEEAARELGWPSGSMSRHLARARDLLRERLAQRDMCLSSSFLAGGWLELLAPAVPAALEKSTIKAAVIFGTGTVTVAGTISTQAVALAEGALQTMLMTKWQIAFAVLLTAGVLGVGTGGLLTKGGPNPVQAADEKKQATGQAQASAPAGGGAGTSTEVQSGLTASAIRTILAKPVQLAKGIDAGTPLKDAMEFLERYEVPILIDTEAFKTDLSMNDVEQFPVQLPVIHSAPLNAVLRLILTKVGATYVVRPGYIEVTTPVRTRPEMWTPENRDKVPLVSVDFQKRPLSECLRELGDMTGISVVLDARGAEAAGQTMVTATLNNVPLDTAVRMLADMGEMKCVVLDGALYVTSRENAATLEEEEVKRKLGGAT